MSIRKFMQLNFRHFNARETLAAAQAWCQFLEDGGQMLLTLGGAMSTAELGISLAKMIRRDKVHAISCSAANLEEDIFNLVAQNEYKTLPHWRHLSVQEEVELRDNGFNRVTDTCIPETVMRNIEHKLIEHWAAAADANESYFPYEFMYKLIDEGHFDDICQADPRHSWVLAAHEKRLPIYTPGWEDSTLGNIFAARVMQGEIANHHAIKPGTMQMEALVKWVLKHHETGLGFFQIGGGIAGDFAICAVPLILQDLRRDCRFWQYFAQISDSTTSYGSYSGAVPNEKITWFKLAPDAPQFMINSDASIVAPLIFAYVLEE